MKLIKLRNPSVAMPAMYQKLIKSGPLEVLGLTSGQHLAQRGRFTARTGGEDMHLPNVASGALLQRRPAGGQPPSPALPVGQPRDVNQVAHQMGEKLAELQADLMAVSR